MQIAARSRAVAALAAALLAAGCAAAREVDPAERADAEKLHAAYLAALVEAYAEGDAERLAEVATVRERTRIANQIAAFESEGRALRPQLKRATVEGVERGGRTALVLVATEVWALRTVALGTDRTIGEALDQTNRVEYHLIRDQGRWWVLTRLLRASSAGE